MRGLGLDARDHERIDRLPLISKRGRIDLKTTATSGAAPAAWRRRRAWLRRVRSLGERHGGLKKLSFRLRLPLARQLLRLGDLRLGHSGSGEVAALNGVRRRRLLRRPAK